MNGAEQIAQERQRQLAEEDWSLDHDQMHTSGELAGAAARYAMPPRLRELPILNNTLGGLVWPNSPDHYGWRAWAFKPSPDDRVRELVKAGALITAEIDRLERGRP